MYAATAQQRSIHGNRSMLQYVNIINAWLGQVKSIGSESLKEESSALEKSPADLPFSAPPEDEDVPENPVTEMTDEKFQELGFPVSESESDDVRDIVRSPTENVNYQNYM